MRKIFIDCGSHDGCSVRKFMDLYDKDNEFEYFCFEINKLLESYYSDILDRINLQFKAVDVSDGQKPMYRMGLTGGSTMNQIKAETLLEKQYGRKDCMLFDFDQVHKSAELRTQKVETIDLSKWIKNNFSETDYIVLKMDIEGSEYDIINHMCENNCFSYINEFRVEFHAPCKTRDYRKPSAYNFAEGLSYHQEYKSKIRDQNKEIIIDNHWDAMHPPYLKNKFAEEYYKTYIRDRVEYREELSFEEKIECCKLFLLSLEGSGNPENFFMDFKDFLNKSSLIEGWKDFIFEVATKKISL